MTSTIILNLFVSIVAIAGLTALMRSAYLLDDGSFSPSPAEEQFEPSAQLERAA